MQSLKPAIMRLALGLIIFSFGCSRSSPTRPVASTPLTFDVESGPFAAGKRVVEANGCFRCHTIAGVRGAVPANLKVSESPAPNSAGASVNQADSSDEEADDSNESDGFRLGDFLNRPLIQALDQNKDGKLSKEEWIAGVKQFFKKLDKENSGKLDQKKIADGLTAIIQVPRGFWGSRKPAFGLGELFAPAIVLCADLDKDGQVTEKEFVAAAEAMFQQADRRRQGALDENQIAKAINRLGTISQTGDPGAIPGPDLGKVGLPSTHTVDWFKAYVRNPKKQKPNARMPAFEGKINDEDLTALAEYLASLK